MPPPRTPATRDELAAQLRVFGVGEGDTLLVHSSLRAMGPVEGGAEAVLGALLDVVGDGGLLLAPTYTYFTERFDPRYDRSVTGQLTETMRARPGAHRSWHPTHSVVAIGPGAAEITAGHHLMAANGIGSPFDQAARRGGWVLLAGVAHNANSTIHVGEAHAKVPFLHVPFTPTIFTSATVVTPDGEVTVPIIDPSGCSKAFSAIEHRLRAKGAVRDGRWGGSLIQLMRGQVLIDTTVEMLGEDPGALLCTDPACYRCMESRKCIEKAQA